MSSRGRRARLLFAASVVAVASVPAAGVLRAHAAGATLALVTPPGVTQPGALAASGSTLYVAGAQPSALTGATLTALDTAAGTSSTLMPTGWHVPAGTSGASPGQGDIEALAPVTGAVLFSDINCGGGLAYRVTSGTPVLLQSDFPPLPSAGCENVYQRLAAAADQSTVYAVGGPYFGGATGNGGYDVWTRAAAANGDTWGIASDPTTGTRLAGLDATPPVTGAAGALNDVTLVGNRLYLAYTTGLAVQTLDGSPCGGAATLCATTGFGDASTGLVADGAPLSTPAFGANNSEALHQAVDASGDVFVLTYDGHVVEAATDGHWHVIAGGSNGATDGAAAAGVTFGLNPGGIAVVGSDVYVSSAAGVFKIPGVAGAASSGTEATSSFVLGGSAVLAGCVQTSQVIVRLNDGTSFLSGHTVTAQASSGTPRAVGPASQVTDLNGAATFQICDLNPGTDVVSFVDGTTGVTLTRTATIPFLSEAQGEAGFSAVDASPVSVPVGPVRTTRITVHLGDSVQAIGNHTVSLTASTRTAQIVTADPATADSNGDVAFTAFDTVVEPVIFTATDTTSNVAITMVAQVQFTDVEATASTVVASSTGGPSSTIRVTLTDGTTPFAGDQVGLVPENGTSTVVAPRPALADSQGAIAFQVSDATPETVTYAAQDLTTGVQIDQMATVRFLASCVATCSSMTASPSSLPAGVARAAVTVSLNDGSRPVAGDQVVLSADHASATIYPQRTVTTDAQGVAAFWASDVNAEVDTFSAVDEGPPNAPFATPLPLTATAQVTFTPEEAVASSVTASPATAKAGGRKFSIVTVQLAVRAPSGSAGASVVPLTGHTVLLSANHPSAVVSPIGNSVSDAQGAVQFLVVDPTPEVDTYRATDATDHVVIAQTASVSFVSGGATALPASTTVSTDSLKTCPVAGLACGAEQPQHPSEVEPSTFAHGSTIVSAFQVGRFKDGGSENIGYAISTDGGVTWPSSLSGFLPGTTTTAGYASAYTRVDDASVAYDARTDTWLIGYDGMLDLPSGGAGGVAMLVSGLTIHGNKVSVTAPQVVVGHSTPGNADPMPDWDKGWMTCDDWPSSTHYGSCYDTFTNNASGLIWNATFENGAWQPPVRVIAPGASTSAPPFVDAPPYVSATDTQPFVQPDGTVLVVAIPSSGSGMLAYWSKDGGASWQTGDGAGNPTTFADTWGCMPRPSDDLRDQNVAVAAMDAGGRVYVAFRDSSFRMGPVDPSGNSCPTGSPNGSDIVLTSSTDGVHWTPLTRVAMDATSTGTDHVIPGIGIDPATQGATGHITVTAYQVSASCSAQSACLTPLAATSTDGGATWTVTTGLAPAFSATWLATSLSDGDHGSALGFVGDYTGTVYSGGHPVTVIPVYSKPQGGGAMQEHMEGVRIS